LDQVIAYGGDSESDLGKKRTVTPELVSETLGLVDQERLFELTDAVGEKDTSKGILILNQLIDSGIDLPEFVNSLLQHLRNLLMMKVGGDSIMLFDLTDNYIQKYREKSSAFSEEDLLRMTKVVVDLNMNLKRASDPRILLEMTLMKLLKMESSVNLAEVLDKLNLLEGRELGCVNSSDAMKSKTFPTQPLKSTATKQSTKIEGKEGKFFSAATKTESSDKTLELSLEEIQKRWDEVLGKIKKTKLSLWSLLKDGEIMGLEDDTLTVEFHNGRNFHKKQAERKENFNLIKKTLGEVFDQPCSLRFELNEAKMSSSAKPGNLKSTSGQDEAAKDPLVKSIMDTFEGEII